MKRRAHAVSRRPDSSWKTAGAMGGAVHLQRALTGPGARFRLVVRTGALPRAGGAYGNSATISFGR